MLSNAYSSYMNRPAGSSRVPIDDESILHTRFILIPWAIIE